MVGPAPTIRSRLLHRFALKEKSLPRVRIALYVASSSTRASSDSVDDSDSREWIHLKTGVDHRGCGPISLRGHCIMLCGGVRLPSGESGGARQRGWSQGLPGRCPRSL
ncbi:hypothetical protein M9H77_08342 [Catharanthus roseus]|uniref:Uncharacterized protein n=1 Tax=Catharanthus roseus TaxID=4058 RepID=A0ACC0BXG1_CATRO|nr:hypothetical protein M9H77_08342 [Catharanthus roseus]